MIYDLQEIGEIDGSKAVSQDDEGTVTTEDGREWVWINQSYSDSSTGHNRVMDGEWSEYQPEYND